MKEALKSWSAQNLVLGAMETPHLLLELLSDRRQERWCVRVRMCEWQVWVEVKVGNREAWQGREASRGAEVTTQGGERQTGD